MSAPPSLFPLAPLRRAAEIQGPAHEQFNGLTRGQVLSLVSVVNQARTLLEEAWKAIAVARQPDDAKAVAENRLLECIEEFLRATAE